MMKQKTEKKESTSASDSDGGAEIKSPVSVSFRTTFVFGFLFTSLLTMVAYELFMRLSGNTLIGWVGAIATGAYFGIEGIIEIPIAHKGIPLIFGERVSWVLLGEGRHWILPPFLMSVKSVDARTQRKQIPLTKVLSQDEIPLEATVSLAWRIKHPILYSQIEDATGLLEDLADSTIRSFFSEQTATNLPKDKKGLSEKLEKILDEETAKWGMDIEKAIVESIRLPESIEQANAKKEVEKSEKDAETTELEHVAALAKKLKEKFPDLSDEKIFNIIQAERGKIKRTVVDGNASSFEKAASLIGRDPKGG